MHMTPEQTAQEILEHFDLFDGYPNIAAEIVAALRATERAAYERAAQAVQLECDQRGEPWIGEVCAAAIRQLDTTPPPSPPNGTLHSEAE